MRYVLTVLMLLCAPLAHATQCFSVVPVPCGDGAAYTPLAPPFGPLLVTPMDEFWTAAVLR